ncbi:MAG: hypothetical protein S0880_05015 [Actinomycetota bacterium]|nr:hypothetical protein [Actinomycetota bacterium]
MRELFPGAHHVHRMSYAFEHEGGGMCNVYALDCSPVDAAGTIRAERGAPSTTVGSHETWTERHRATGYDVVQSITVVHDAASMPLVRRLPLPEGTTTFVVEDTSAVPLDDRLEYATTAPAAPSRRRSWVPRRGRR